MTIAKFRISSYFAQITSVENCFRKYHSKVLMRFSFFEIEESSKIAILAAWRRRQWPGIGHFLFARTDQRDDIYHYNPPINFRAILLATLRHVLDSYHAITPVWFDICPPPLIPTEKKHSLQEKGQHESFDFHLHYFKWKKNDLFCRV